MDPAQIPAIHFTMHPSGVWTLEGDRETYVGPCNTQVVVPAGSPDISELTRQFFRSVSITRPTVPVPESSEEEDPEEGSTPPLSQQLMPMPDDEQMLPLMVPPLDAVPMMEDEPVPDYEPEQPYYLSDESEDMAEAPAEEEHVVYLEGAFDEDPDGPVYIPGDPPVEDEDWFDEDLAEEEFLEEQAEDVPDWVLDDMGDFGYDSDLSAVSGVTSLDSMTSVDSYAGSS